ncbi:MAG: serpin family protein [Bacteroidales bacterium]|nr:serpin family protein [Bacteroidales bacterium]MDD4670274.1 serpin family protein [Bacteroidales bacterium]
MLTKGQQELLNGGNAFAFELFKNITQADPGANVFISPLSVASSWSMLANGASGETYNQIVTALGHKDYNMDEINNYYKYLFNSLYQVDPSVTMSMANSLWIQDGFPVYGTYKQNLSEYYDSESNIVDFSKTSTIKKINKWASNKTNGLIPQVVTSADSKIKMMLANALYFEGQWKFPFTKEANKKDVFTCCNGVKKQIDYMIADIKFSYYDNDVTISALSYGNGTYQMVLLLPDENTDIQTFINNLTWKKWDNWMTSANYDYEVKLKIPKFSDTYDAKGLMIPALQKMNVELPFETNADFSKMSSSPLYINRIISKSTIDVNEYGTVASTVFVVPLYRTHTPSKGTIDMNLNRPFVYIIKEQSTNAILFMGVKNK